MTEMAIRGKNYREDYDYELYGEPVTAILRPLVDDEFLPIAAFLAEHLDMDEDAEEEEAVSEAIDKVEEAKEDEEAEQPIDVSKLDDEFVAIMQEAAILGIEGERGPDGDEIELDEEEVENFVTGLMGGYSVELGGKVLELSGDVRDADKFRGTRGSVGGSGNS